jgi:hypothetical protein
VGCLNTRCCLHFLKMRLGLCVSKIISCFSFLPRDSTPRSLLGLDSPLLGSLLGPDLRSPPRHRGPVTSSPPSPNLRSSVCPESPPRDLSHASAPVTPRPCALESSPGSSPPGLSLCHRHLPPQPCRQALLPYRPLMPRTRHLGPYWQNARKERRLLALLFCENLL